MNIRTAISLATQSLKKSASPVLDAEVLLSFVLKKPKEFLYGHPDFKLSEIQDSDSQARESLASRLPHGPQRVLWPGPFSNKRCSRPPPGNGTARRARAREIKD